MVQDNFSHSIQNPQTAEIQKHVLCWRELLFALRIASFNAIIQFVICV